MTTTPNSYPTNEVTDRRGPHWFSLVLCVATFLLIIAGGLVTTTGSGLSVPDWPNTYGYFMFAYPLSKMVGPIRYEHTHRLIASTVGFLTILLSLWLLRSEPRRWVRQLGGIALLAVIVQGVLGGMTVLQKLPVAVSVLHACVAQSFFCLVVALALVTSPGWLEEERGSGTLPPGDRNLRALCITTTGVVFLQIILGAWMRHTHSGMAIPDFPLSFGKLVPAFVDKKIVINYAHRVGALVVTVFILWTACRTFLKQEGELRLLVPAISLVGLLVLQVGFAGLAVLTGLGVVPTTAHVATGALLLATSLVLTLRSFRVVTQEDRASGFASSTEPASQ